MTRSIITAIIFALALIATLYDLFVGDKKIENEKKRKKKINKRCSICYSMGFFADIPHHYIMHER